MSIIVNDNIQVNSGKALDNKYLKNGIAPYADVNDVNTTIPLSYRSPYLTVVIGTQEYWYFNGVTNTDLVVKSSAIQTDITVSNLQTLISGGLLVVGVKYAITDFQDRNINDVNSRVIVTATSNNTISQSGFWKRLTTNKAYGAFALNSGTSGSVDQITVGATPLMTASIPYTTSRINTANLVAANVNANSGVSGYSAIVIAGEPIIDRPAIIIESTTAGVNTSSLSVSVTTLTVTNLVNLTMGVAESEQVLDISYDITVDRITSCYDNVYDIRMTYTSQRITALGYNPIVNWRWGHSTFRNWTFYNVAYRNYFDFPSTSGANTIEQNNNLIDGSFDGVVMRRTSPITASFSNNIANINFSNVQLLGVCQINSNNIYLLFTNITASSTLNVVGNIGNYSKNILNSSTLGRLLLSGFSSVGAGTINTNCIVSGQISLNARFQSTVNVSNNIVNATVGNASAADNYLQSFTITGNNISGSLTFPSGGDRDFVISISNNLISSSTLTLQSFNITVIGKTLSITNSTFSKGTYTISAVGTDNFTSTNNIFEGGATISGTYSLVSMSNSKLNTISWSFNNYSMSVSGSIINNHSINGTNNPNRALTFTTSVINYLTHGGVPNISVINSEVSYTVINSFSSGGLITINKSNIFDCNMLSDEVGGEIANVNITECRMFKTSTTLQGQLSTATYNFTNSDLFNSNIQTFGSSITNFDFIDSKCDGLDFNKLGITESPASIYFTSSNIFKSVLRTNGTTNIFGLNNSEFSSFNVTSNDGGSFTFDSCVMKYNTFDFSTDLSGSNYDFINLSIIKGNGIYKSIFTFDGSSGKGQANVHCQVISDMIGQDIFKSIITKATISTVTGLTAGAGANISLGNSIAPNDQYIPTSLVSSLNSNYQLKNEPVGVANNATKYSIELLPTVNDITAGSVEVAVDFLIAP